MSDSFRILCLETSAQICSVSVATESGVFHSVSDTIQNHAEVLMRLIQDCLDKSGTGMKDISAIAISDGPGSYTGLRIGSSTAKGLCYALQVPLIKVSTLGALAQAALTHTEKTIVWPMIDARRMEVYHGIYNSELELLQAINNGIIDQEGFVPDWLKSEAVIICGDGGEKAAKYLGLPFLSLAPSSAYLCPLATAAWHQKDFVDAVSYEPFYLKQANITVAK